MIAEQSADDIETYCFIIERIKDINRRRQSFMERTGKTGGWCPNRKHIFSGCYDVWFTEQDKIDAREMPNFHLNQAREAGFIDIVSGNQEWTWADEWFITPNGEKAYTQYLNSKTMPPK